MVEMDHSVDVRGAQQYRRMVDADEILRHQVVVWLDIAVVIVQLVAVDHCVDAHDSRPTLVAAQHY